ncbi:hypothetical protein ACHAWF_016820 [Thalassiosira exigua]
MRDRRRTVARDVGSPRRRRSDGTERADRPDGTDASGRSRGSRASAASASASEWDDGDSTYDLCRTVDESMAGLHARFDGEERGGEDVATWDATTAGKERASEAAFERDWILDGTDSEGEGGGRGESRARRRRRRRELGDPALDQIIGMLEIENQSFTTGTRSVDTLDGDDRGGPTGTDGGTISADEGEEAIEFADFSRFDAERDGGIRDDLARDNLQHDVLYEYERKDPREGTTQGAESAREEGRARPADAREAETRGAFSSRQESPLDKGSRSSDAGGDRAGRAKAQDEPRSAGYQPPDAIECLVSDLTAELDATIRGCLSPSPDDLPASESDGSSSSSGNVDRSNLDDELDRDGDEDVVDPPAPPRPERRPPSTLMSSRLLEALPPPMPAASSSDDDDDALAASFTRRIQRGHAASRGRGGGDDASTESTRCEDEALEARLADAIHSGYYAGAEEGRDGDRFDAIVLEEVLHVPWPFHVLDLDEPFLDEESETDSDASEGERGSARPLHFDTYVSHRLSQLDCAVGEVTKCLRRRVSRKGDALDAGIDAVFAAELELSAALMFAKSSREFLDRAKNGYPLPEGGRHDAASGSLDVVRRADARDRLRDLSEALDRIASVRDEDARWWDEANSAGVVPPSGFRKLVDDAKRLQELVRGEEVLHHAECLAAMRERLEGVPDALLGCVEESLAELVARLLFAEERPRKSFDEYFSDYEALLQAWLSCHQMQQRQPDVIAAEWSGCVLRVLCFEVSRAAGYAVQDSQVSDNDADGECDNIIRELNQIKVESKDPTEVESLCHRLLIARLGGGHNSNALSSIFHNLCSRLVELMNVYCLILQWHDVIVKKISATSDSNLYAPAVGQSEYVPDQSESEHSFVSSISSDKQSYCSTDEQQSREGHPGDVDVTRQDEASMPENLEFRMSVSSNIDELKLIQKCMELIRRALWKKCETALVNLVKFYLSQGEDAGVPSGDGADFATGNLRLMHGLLLQFASFSSYFLAEDKAREVECNALENELSRLYRRHFRSIHIEAMKTTGTLLMHEPWLLAPLELPGQQVGDPTGMKCRCGVSGVNCDYCVATMQAIYKAVRGLLMGPASEVHRYGQHFVITKRSEDRGYGCCTAFAHFLEDTPPCHQTFRPSDDESKQLEDCFGTSSKEFSSMILPLVEIKPCGSRSLSILTQSSANGVLKWTARLLAVGNALPLVADDASAAVMTLIDLYIFTVFRFCARSKLNEDVLIGLGRGSAAQLSSSTSVSLTMEADPVAPLPRECESFAQLQEFVKKSRERLDGIVNLDKFQSSDEDTCPTSPRSKDAVFQFAKRLEKEAAASCSSLFAAILVDVASNIFTKRQNGPSQEQPLWADLKDLTTSIENGDEVTHRAKTEASLEDYASSAVSVMPKLSAQMTQFATVKSISGKDLIFQVICCGRWESNIMQEQSNAYVDGFGERVAIVWGYLSSSGRLPRPTLHYTWDQLVKSTFMLLLEGFSKVNKCSTEGRSLMSMDLATLSHALIPESVMDELEDEYPKVSSPPHCCRDEMMRYVDTFIKVFYFPNEDILNWIEENSGDYHLDHCISLVTSKAAGCKDKKFLQRGQMAVTHIYNRSH